MHINAENVSINTYTITLGLYKKVNILYIYIYYKYVKIHSWVILKECLTWNPFTCDCETVDP